MTLPTNPKPLVRVAEWLEKGAPHKTTNGATVFGFSMKEGVLAYDKGAQGCGTICCIAGAVVQFTQPVITDNQILEQQIPPNGRHNPGYGSVFANARGLCGMDFIDASKLFEPDNVEEWGSIEAKKAAKVIRHYLKTGEVNWENPGEKA